MLEAGDKQLSINHCFLFLGKCRKILRDNGKVWMNKVKCFSLLMRIICTIDAHHSFC